MLRVKLSNIEGCSRGCLIYSVTQRLSYTAANHLRLRSRVPIIKEFYCKRKKRKKRKRFFFFHIIRKFVSYFNHYLIENIIFSITFLILVHRGGGLTHSPLGNQLSECQPRTNFVALRALSIFLSFCTPLSHHNLAASQRFQGHETTIYRPPTTINVALRNHTLILKA
jgi:hypothetical protein